jgi:hypothetical protein
MARGWRRLPATQIVKATSYNAHSAAGGDKFYGIAGTIRPAVKEAAVM